MSSGSSMAWTSLCDVGLFNSRGASDSVHRQSRGHSCCSRETGTQLQAVLGMAAVKEFFDAFCLIFRAPPVVPESSASFRSPRALTPMSARGLQGVPESPGV